MLQTLESQSSVSARRSALSCLPSGSVVASPRVGSELAWQPLSWGWRGRAGEPRTFPQFLQDGPHPLP